MVLSAGFEPAHPKITELKSVALDHSAMIALNSLIVLFRTLEMQGLEPWTSVLLGGY